MLPHLNEIGSFNVEPGYYIKNKYVTDLDNKTIGVYWWFKLKQKSYKKNVLRKTNRLIRYLKEIFKNKFK